MKTLLELATEVYADKFVYDLTSPIQAEAWIETVGMKLFDNQPTKEGTEFFVIQLFKWKLVSTTAKFYESRLNAPSNTMCIIDSPSGFQYVYSREEEDFD